MPNKHLIAAGLLGLFSATSQAQDLSIEFTNLTQGIYFTPIIAAAHDSTAHIYQVSTAASAELEALAEGGDISGVSASLATYDADIIENPALGLLNAGESTSFDISSSDGNTYLSVAAMMLPTNDGFVGLDSWEIPSEAGTYTVYLNAYDSGTEVNDEIIDNIPNPIGVANTGATGVTDEETNSNVHIHRGALGDSDATGGKSDLDNTVHRWLNPVAKMTVTVQ